jgi:arginase
MNCNVIGLPIELGASQSGCLMGPDAFRTAGILTALTELNHTVTDQGNLSLQTMMQRSHPNQSIRNLPEISGWIETIHQYCAKNANTADVQIFLGGDHSISAGTVPAMAHRAQIAGRPFYVLWLDAHSDFHTLNSTMSGNLHGTPVGYFTGRDGFDGYYPKLPAVVKPENVCMMGIRSLDQAEKVTIAKSGIRVFDMRSIDENGVVAPLREFLKTVSKNNGTLHVSFDVDFLDPSLAPAVGTTVPGGATFREAHLIMEILFESGLVTSLDLAELNPFLDERGKTATLMVDLCASLLGRTVLDKQTKSF